MSSVKIAFEKSAFPILTKPERISAIRRFDEETELLKIGFPEALKSTIATVPPLA